MGKGVVVGVRDGAGAVVGVGSGAAVRAGDGVAVGVGAAVGVGSGLAVWVGGCSTTAGGGSSVQAGARASGHASMKNASANFSVLIPSLERTKTVTAAKSWAKSWSVMSSSSLPITAANWSFT